MTRSTWPREDGSYVAFIDPEWEYLRFFPRGLVASVTSLLPPRIFAPRIQLGLAAISYGSSTNDGKCLTVTTENDEGAVEYRIRSAGGDALIVESHSRVNGARFTTFYNFFPS